MFEAIQLNKKGFVVVVVYCCFVIVVSLFFFYLFLFLFRFEEGTALAIKIVSGIFLETKGTVFLNTYLASYYRCLQEVLFFSDTIFIQ